MVPESAIKEFLARVRDAEYDGSLPNAQVIGRELIGEPAFENTVAVVDECKRRGLLSRADNDYTGVTLSLPGEAFLNA
jgi:hypothetical protein